MSAAAPGASPHSVRWLSREWAEQLAAMAASPRPRGVSGLDFDVLILGSGYGAAVAAAELSGVVDDQGRAPRVAVLERGREFLPGSFPARMADLPTELRGSVAGQSRGGEGLFDLRLGGEMGVVLANGLGGGSLINAGVMEIPEEEVFQQGWPARFSRREALLPLYREAKHLLGATVGKDGGDNHIAQLADLPDKTRVLQTMGAGRYRHAAITVALAAKTTVGGVQLSACKQCGDCATGCNYGAKESLDTNLLALAQARGVEIYCGATALCLRRGDSGWEVEVVHTDERLREREGRPAWVSAQRVIVAAGALGSTELLLRSQQRAGQGGRPLRFSSRLGQGFSGNGDMISFGYAHGPRANAFADEDMPPAARKVGPTITGVIDAELPAAGARHGHIVIEEMAVPGPLRRFTEELITTADTVHSLSEHDTARHAAEHPEHDPIAVQPKKIAHTSVLAAMGDDGAAGWLELSDDEGDAPASAADGRLRVRWPELPGLPLFTAQNEAMAKAAQRLGQAGRHIANPIWQPLPAAMQQLIGNARGPLLSVHPLGGCAMADDAARGVVDSQGRVFDADGDGTAVHEGLHVLDGAVIPSALATNPALTIAVVALDAVRRLRDDWGWKLQPQQVPAPAARPVLADTEREIIERQQSDRQQKGRGGTWARFSERLSGEVRLRNHDGVDEDCIAELTLTYRELPLRRLFKPQAGGRLSHAMLLVGGRRGGSEGVLRIYRKADWEAARDLWPGHPLLEAQRPPVLAHRVSGSLTVLRRAARGVPERVLRGLAAWIPNRGLRDSVQALCKYWTRRRAGYLQQGPGFGALVMDALKLANHAGEVRLFEYDLRVGAPLGSDGPHGFLPLAEFEGARLKGVKRITYARPGNPWRQLMELPLSGLPGLAPGSAPPVLVLDPVYFASRGAPLFQITAQREHAEALADAASLMACFARLLLTIHLWSARKPDTPPPRLPQRLPGELPGLPVPDIHWLEVDQHAGQPVEIRLARYRRKGGALAGPPVVLIHGYSASGTTFAHPSLKPSLAGALAAEGRDVWVLDLRSSCGLPTAMQPWTFERIALADIPAAIDHVLSKSGEAQVDVIAHCMGAAMLGMAVLSADLEIDEVLGGREQGQVPDRFRSQRRRLPGCIRRAVLSQVGPVMVLSPEVIFRAYALSFIEQVLGGIDYRFRPDADAGLGSDLYDRLLGSLPYPDDELLLENNWKLWRDLSPLGTRHRMDALYGRTFKLANLRPETLAAIDDFFGPLNLDTVSQVMHFAALRTITNRAGRNRFVNRERLARLWRFQTLSLHGDENGLADFATLRRMQRVFDDAGCAVQTVRLPGRGHQDTLIGREVADTFAHIGRFLSAESLPAAPAAPRYLFVARPPTLGPMLLPVPVGDDAACQWWLSLGCAPELGEPIAVCLWPASRQADGRWQADESRLAVWQARPGKGCAWLSNALPDWAQQGGASHLLLLLIYPQPGSMGLPVLSTRAGEGDIVVPTDIWHHPGLRLQTLGNKGAGRLPLSLWLPLLLSWELDGALPEPLRELHRALRTAIDEARGRMAAEPGLPEGIVPLPAAEAVGEPLQLALGSCQYAPGILDTPPAYAAWRHLARAIDQGAETPDWLVLTGDQVYTDATAGLFDPSQPDDRYRKPYEKWLAAADVRDLMRRAPLLAAIDDHEIEDNWEPASPALPEAQRLPHGQAREHGLKAFQRYQRPHAQPSPAAWFHCRRHGVPVFVLDTRSARAHRDARTEGALMDPAQREALMAWLRAEHARDPAGPKLIVGAGLLLPRHRAAVPARLANGQADQGNPARLRSDSWDGYPAELHALLAAIAQARWQGLVFLSGDEHLGLASEITLKAGGGEAVRVLSLHAPGLYTPYRFANSQAWELVPDEDFGFAAAGTPIAVGVRTQCFSDPGFLRITLRPDAGRWTLRCKAGPGSGVLIGEWTL